MIREKSCPVSIEKVHEYFMTGEKLSVIAYKFSVSEARIQQMISTNRKLNPEKWPKRQQKKITKEREVLEAVDIILKEAIESLDKGEKVNGLEYARKLIARY